MLDRIDGVLEREDRVPGPLDQLLDKERWDQLNDLCSDFSPRDRRFMELYFGRGLSPAEVAQVMKNLLEGHSIRSQTLQNSHLFLTLDVVLVFKPLN